MQRSVVFVVNFVPRPLPVKYLFHALSKVRGHLVHPVQMLDCQIALFALSKSPRIRHDVSDLPSVCLVGFRD